MYHEFTNYLSLEPLPSWRASVTHFMRVFTLITTTTYVFTHRRKNGGSDDDGKVEKLPDMSVSVGRSLPTMRGHTAFLTFAQYGRVGLAANPRDAADSSAGAAEVAGTKAK